MHRKGLIVGTAALALVVSSTILLEHGRWGDAPEPSISVVAHEFLERHPQFAVESAPDQSGRSRPFPRFEGHTSVAVADGPYNGILFLQLDYANPLAARVGHRQFGVGGAYSGFPHPPIRLSEFEKTAMRHGTYARRCTRQRCSEAMYSRVMASSVWLIYAYDIDSSVLDDVAKKADS